MDKGNLMTHVVSGHNLALKPKGSSGANTAVSSNREGTERSHLLADWFQGSGYKEALSLMQVMNTIMGQCILQKKR